VSLVAYLLGFKLLLVPVLLWFLVRYMPFPKLFQSKLSRLVVSFLILVSLLLLSIVVQFFLFEDRGFGILAVLLTAATMLTVWIAHPYKVKEPSAPLVDRKDAAALAMALLFIVPVISLTGVLKSSVVDVSRFGAIQSADGANHFMIFSTMSDVEHLDYRGGSYYPKGFHLSVAFIQDSAYLNPTEHRFGINARLFVLQYIFFGALMAYMLFYLCRFVADILSVRSKRQRNLQLALTLGLPLAAFYLLSFFYQGFLNYYYVITAVAAGLIYLHSAFAADKIRRPDGRLFLLGYLVLTFGVSMIWPLLMPPLVLIPLMYLLPPKDEFRLARLPALLRSIVAKENLLIIGGFALHLIPVFMQMRYAIMDTGEQFTAHGSIRVFQAGILTAGLLLIVYISLNERFSDEVRRFVSAVFHPLYLFIAALAIAQFFTAGEVRYYAIKSSFLLEILLLVIVTVGLVYAYNNSKASWMQKLYMPALTLIIGFLLLAGMHGNPLKDVRELFRTQSGFGTPVFFDSDVKKLTDVASSGKVHDTNLAVLHYDAESDKFYGNMAPANWITVMQPKPASDPFTQMCNSELYTIATYREFDKVQQLDLKAKARECAQMAADRNRDYFVVTDDASAPHIATLFGPHATVVH
jgi:hypothetical protein